MTINDKTTSNREAGQTGMKPMWQNRQQSVTVNHPESIAFTKQFLGDLMQISQLYAKRYGVEATANEPTLTSRYSPRLRG